MKSGDEQRITEESETRMDDIDSKHLVITTYKSTGPGGQHRNTTESAVRVKHLPTGIIVTASESRSQHENREKAMERLRQRLAVLHRRKKHRIPTKPGRAAKERRLEKKSRHSDTKRGRKKIEF